MMGSRDYKDLVRLPECVVDTCNDWHSADRLGDLNVDVGGCASVRHSLFMNTLKPNITGHWCKVWLAVQRCESRRYRYMVFRDDDTKFDIWACDNMRRWWNLAQKDYPENDQKYFNKLFKCGRHGLTCIDKRANLLNEIHCRSSLGSRRSIRRLNCMRYQLKPKKALL